MPMVKQKISGKTLIRAQDQLSGFPSGVFPKHLTAAPTQEVHLFTEFPPPLDGCLESPAIHCILESCPVARG